MFEHAAAWMYIIYSRGKIFPEVVIEDTWIVQRRFTTHCKANESEYRIEYEDSIIQRYRTWDQPDRCEDQCSRTDSRHRRPS